MVDPALSTLPKTIVSMPSRSVLIFVPQVSLEAPTSGLTQL
jgi:hypothetical protein